MSIEELLGAEYSEQLISSTAGLRGTPQIEEVADQSYVKMLSEGVSLVLPDKRTVGAIHLHRMGHEGFSGYVGRVPGGLAFSMTRDQVRQRLGVPVASADEQVIPILGSKPAWDSYVVGSIRVHLEYLPNGQGVRMITLMAA